MVLIKKLIFALPFLIIFTALTYQITPMLASYDFIFSLSLKTLIDLILISLLFFFSSFLFILFTTIASDWKIILPVGILASAIPLVFTQSALNLIVAVVIFVSLLITNLLLDNSLKKYLTFQPGALLGPSIRNLSSLLIFSFCLIYFLSVNKIIAQNGFQIPDSLIDTSLKLAAPNLPTLSESPATPQLSIPPEQIELLKQNPDLLKQYGLDSKMLDSLTAPQKSTAAPKNLTYDLIKQTINDQVQNIIKPYQNFIPAGLAMLLFFTFQAFVSIANLLISPLLWLIFLILEKTGFTKFVVEQREVKKLVV